MKEIPGNNFGSNAEAVSLIEPSVEDKVEAQGYSNRVNEIYSDFYSYFTDAPKEVVDESAQTFVEAENISYRIKELVDDIAEGDIKMPASEIKESLTEAARLVVHMQELLVVVKRRLREAGYAEVDEVAAAETNPDGGLPLSAPEIFSTQVKVNQETKPEDVLHTEQASERVILRDLYSRFQSGDQELITPQVLYRDLSSLKYVLGKMVVLAGYSDQEYNQIFDTKILPLLDAIIAERRNKQRDPRSIRKLRKQISETMSSLLAGRALSEDALLAETALGVEVVGRDFLTQDEPAEALPVDPSSSESDFEKMSTAADREKVRFETVQKEIVALNEEWRSQLASEPTARIEAALKRIKALLADTVINTTVREQKLQMNLDLVSRLNTELEALRDMAVATPASPEALDINLDTLTPPEPAPSSESLDINLNVLEAENEKINNLKQQCNEVYPEFLKFNYNFLYSLSEEVNGLDLNLLKQEYARVYPAFNKAFSDLILKPNILNIEKYQEAIDDLKLYIQHANEFVTKKGIDVNTSTPASPEPLAINLDTLAPVPRPTPAPAPISEKERTGPNTHEAYIRGQDVDSDIEMYRKVLGRHGEDFTDADKELGLIKEKLKEINAAVKAGASDTEVKALKKAAVRVLASAIPEQSLSNLTASETVIKSKTENNPDPELKRRETDGSEYEKAKTTLSTLRDGEVVKNADGTVKLNAEGTAERTGGYRAEKKAYDAALKKYYEERGIMDKTKNVFAKAFLGREAALPPELLKQQTAYRAKRQAYATALEQALTLRGQSRVDNKDFSLKTPEAMRAFSGKFILKPRAETLAMKTEVMLSKEKASSMASIMEVMRKYPRVVRTVGLATAISFGVAGGGLVGGGLALGRFVASATIGTALSGYVYTRMQGLVDQAQFMRQARTGALANSFTVDTMDSLEQALERDDVAVEVAETRQVSAAAVTGVGFGYAAGLGLSEAFNTPSAPTSESGANADAPEAAASSPEEPTRVNAVSGAGPGTAATLEGSRFSVPVHTVESGDNLTTILLDNLMAQYESGKLPLPGGMTKAEMANLMYEKFPELSNAENPKATLSSAQWRMLGVETGDPGKLQVGDTIMVDALVEKFADDTVTFKASGEGVDQPLRRPGTGPVPISKDPLGDFIVQIENKQFSQPIPSQPDTEFVGPKLDYDPKVSGPRPFSPDGNYLNIPEYKQYLTQYLPGVSVSRLIDSKVDAIEGYTAIDLALGKPRVFDAIKEVTILELEKMQRTPGAIESFATAKGIDENMLHEWLNNLDAITDKKDIPYRPTTVFNDLYTRYVVEGQVTRTLKTK